MSIDSGHNNEPPLDKGKESVDKAGHSSVKMILMNDGPLTNGEKKYVGGILLKWNEACVNFESEFSGGSLVESHGQDYWDEKAMDFRRDLSTLLTSKDEKEYGGFSFYRDSKRSGLDVLDELSRDKDFSYKGDLASYLVYEVWLANRQLELGKPKSEAEKMEVKLMKEKVFPRLTEITVNLLEENNYSAIENYMNLLVSMDETDFVGPIINDERLDISEKTKFMVCFMNQFGVMRGVDLLAAEMGDNEDTKKVYDLVQGRELKKRFSELKSLYSDVDFEKYNSAEFTRKEVDLIEREISDFAGTNGLKVDSINVLDVGAGTGRHAVSLFREGYKVTALEVQPNHVEKIKEKEPNLPVISESWSDLDLANFGGKFDFAYCLERTVLHNRTPGDMLKFFDNIAQALSKNGRLMIDFADTTVGEYKDRVDKYRDNLKSLGVRDLVVQHIFDGVDDDHQFNRMAPSREQIEVYTRLVGLKLVKDPVVDVVEKNGEITNEYYVFEKDSDFYPGNKSVGGVRNILAKIGIYDEKTDYNQLLKSWGMTIGQLIIYGGYKSEVEEYNKTQGIPDVSLIKQPDGTISFEAFGPKIGID